MALIDDLIELGLPAEIIEGEIHFTRPLRSDERNIVQALKIRDMTPEERAAILERRKDLAALLDTLKVKLSSSPILAELRQDYINAVDTLTQIKDAQSMTTAQAVSAIKFMARVLLVILRLLARLYRADNQEQIWQTRN
jgi:hypothetical protein